MTWPTPFAYPSDPHQRMHGPAGYKDYAQYKPWLRDEFTFRCVYCLETGEFWYPDRAVSFSADHVESKKAAPQRILRLYKSRLRLHALQYLEGDGSPHRPHGRRLREAPVGR